MNNVTYSAKKSEVERKWYIIDAANKPLGRGMKETPAAVMMAKNPEKAMMLAVKGMLPHTSLGRQMATKLRTFAGSEHNLQAQKPEIWNF